MTLKVSGYKTWKSAVQQKTKEPEWDETMRLPGVRGEFASHALHLKVFDRDFLGMGDDKLGAARISLAPLESQDEIELTGGNAIKLRDATSGLVSLVVRFMPDDGVASPRWP